MCIIGRVQWQQMRAILVILAALTWTTTSLQPEDRVSAFYQTLHGGVRLNSPPCVISWSCYCICLHPHVFFVCFFVPTPGSLLSHITDPFFFYVLQ